MIKTLLKRVYLLAMATWIFPTLVLLILFEWGVMEVRNACDWISYGLWKVSDSRYYKEPLGYLKEAWESFKANWTQTNS